MTLEQFTQEAGQIARQYEYDDETVVAVDFGTTQVDATVDLVDDTVIVVVEGEEPRSGDQSGGSSLQGSEQYEFELPADVDSAHTFMKNGVLTVEMEGR